MQLQAAYPEFTGRNVEVVAVSADGRADALRMTALAGTTFPVLSDPGGATARDYGVFDLLGDGVATPATFIVRKDGSIDWYRIGVDIADRATVEDIIAALDGS